LNGSINYVEAFDVLKLCIDKEFRLQRVPYEKNILNVHEVQPEIAGQIVGKWIG